MNKTPAAKRPPVIAFAGGGTGGHIYPGLALIGALRENGVRPWGGPCGGGPCGGGPCGGGPCGGGPCGGQPENQTARIIWLGAKKGMDRAIVESAPALGVSFFGIHSGKLRRYLSFRNVLDIFNVIAGCVESVIILKKERPRLLFSKGGFVSVPPVIAARLLKVPVWTHESDVSIGLANRINGRFASKIWLSYKQSLDSLPAGLRGKAEVSGNPVRAVFYRAGSEEEREASAARGRAFLSVAGDAPVLLVLGGSQGAQEVNHLIEQSLPELTKYFVVVHQTGERQEHSAAAAPAAAPRYIRLAYIKDEMPDVLASAALVVGRSGAGTVWECAACGKPMVLVPLAGSGTRGDQVENARYFAQKGAALCLVHPAAAEFTAAVTGLADAPERLKAMTAAARATGAHNAAALIAAEIQRKFLNDVRAASR